MGENQKGFKSPVYRMNIEEQKKLISPTKSGLAMKRTTRSQLRKGNQPWEGRLWESRQAMNKKPIRGRLSGKRWHNTPKSRHLAQEVNGSLGRWRFSFLPGDTSQACGCNCSSASVGNGRCDLRGVSRGHSNQFENREDERCLINYENPPA